MRKRGVSAFLVAVMMLSLAACGGNGMGKVSDTDENELSADEIKTGDFSMIVSLHDPMVWVEDEGDYWMYGTHMTQASGTNLSEWTMYADGVRKSNKIYSNLFDTDETGEISAFSYVGKNTDGGYSVWAPSVIYNDTMGKYMMYFCTTSTYIKSNLVYAVSDTPEGPYEYVDTILYSGFTKNDIDKTDFYEVMGDDVDIKDYVISNSFLNELWPNCIDPALFYDEDGRLWMVYGSWSGGIFLLEIDKETGDVIHPEVSDHDNNIDRYYGKRLLGGGHHSIEGPYIHYDSESGYYYLFVSYGNLQANGGYQIRQFRASAPDGDYVDVTGSTPWNQDDYNEYGIKMMGNYKFPSMNKGYMAPGGQSTFTDKDGKRYVVYHQRFDNGSESHEPRIHQMFLNEDGWFVAAPFQTNGEALSDEGYTDSDICGTYYIVNHGVGVNANLIEAVPTVFSTDGTFTGEKYEGTFAVTEGTDFITVTIDGVSYKGVIVDMVDEAGNNTRCFTAVGSNNKTIWGVHYVR